MLSIKEDKGITLVSLVITIVIMLILAGVAISFVIGQNGLFNKSKTSSEMYKNASDKEQNELNNAENEIAAIDIDEESKVTEDTSVYNLLADSCRPSTVIDMNGICTKNDDGTFSLISHNISGSAGIVIDLPSDYSNYSKLQIKVKDNVVTNTTRSAYGLFKYDRATSSWCGVYSEISYYNSENNNIDYMTFENDTYTIDISNLKDFLGDSSCVGFAVINGIDCTVTNMYLEK